MRDVYVAGQRVLVTLRGSKLGEIRKGIFVHDGGPLASSMAVKFGPKKRLVVWKQQVQPDFSPPDEPSPQPTE